jgi:hypothetical protein
MNNKAELDSMFGDVVTIIRESIEEWILRGLRQHGQQLYNSADVFFEDSTSCDYSTAAPGNETPEFHLGKPRLLKLDRV